MVIIQIRHILGVAIIRLLFFFKMQIKMNFLNMWLHS
jgi:hypothetical protein